MRRALQQWWRRHRVPVIYQLNAVECGIACLAMVLESFGHRHAMPALRRVCDPGRDGLTTDELANAARSLGFRAETLSVQHVDGYESCALPVIVHWRRNHFVVLEEIRKDKDAFVIVDPACGRQMLTKKEFDEAASKVYLTLSTNQASQAYATSATTLATLATWPEGSSRGWPFLISLIRAARAWRSLWLLSAYSLALQIVGLITPLLTQRVVDTIIPGKLTSPLAWLAAGVVLIVCTQTLLRYARASTLTTLQASLDTELMTRFVAHLLELPLRFFQHRSPGDLLMRLAANASVRELITGYSLGVVFDGLFVSGYLVLLLIWSPLFAAIAFVLGALQASILLFTRTALKTLTDRQISSQAEAHGFLVEALHSISTIKTTGAEAFIIKRWSTLFHTQMDLSVRRQRLAGVFESGLTGLRLFSTLAFLWCGAHEVLLGHLTLGTMLGLNALAAGFLMPIGSLVGSLQQFHLVRTEFARILDVLEALPEQPRELASVRPPRTMPIAGQIVFDRVSFRYHASAPLVLSDISFVVSPGQLVAIVGRTGSGKSTLARLLLGLHEPTAGDIFIDGAPLTAFDYRALRRQCGVVCQDSQVFALTIRENIAFGRLDVPFGSIVRAATLAGIHDEIVQMPMRYDTSVLDAGSGLSAGQRQRILLARAMVHRPALLVLDEATSHLDRDTEQHLSRTILSLPCTRLLITHHLSTIQHADTIIVLDVGRIAEMGTHEELLARDGLYAGWIRRRSRLRDHANGARGEFPDRGIVLSDRGG
jgi:ATP-binding cassette subfamily B protein